jgi:hypothetical protein
VSSRKRTGPASREKLRKVDEAFVAELDSLGFFRFASLPNKEGAKREILARGYPLAHDVGRSFMADGEELSEGGVGDLVGRVAPLLRQEGVRIEVDPPHLRLSREPGADLVEFTEDCGPEIYRLRLGPEEIVFDNGWAEATTQTIALLDVLLARHRSAERAWVIYGGGNEGILWIATDAQASLVNSALPEREKLAKIAW